MSCTLCFALGARLGIATIEFLRRIDLIGRRKEREPDECQNNSNGDTDIGNIEDREINEFRGKKINNIAARQAIDCIAHSAAYNHGETDNFKMRKQRGLP